MALSWTMDKLGVLGRSAEDCGVVLGAIAGHDPRDASSIDCEFSFPPDEPLKPPFKLATLKGATDLVQPEIKANFQAALNLLAREATITEVELPQLPYAAVAATIIECEMAAAFEELVDNGKVWEMTAPEDRTGIHAGLLIPAKDYINALRIRRIIQQALDKLISPFDALVQPTLASVAGPIDKKFVEYQRRFRGASISGGANLAGLPGITVPSGTGERGLPTGLKFVGRAFDEHRVLALAQHYQGLTAWHEEYPKLPE
jgi:aspartyl-tRNA(Asn)/glutamyl-tRNA(Gln) amidotransferase subunit A